MFYKMNKTGGEPNKISKEVDVQIVVKINDCNDQIIKNNNYNKNKKSVSVNEP